MDDRWRTTIGFIIWVYKCIKAKRLCKIIYSVIFIPSYFNLNNRMSSKLAESSGKDYIFDMNSRYLYNSDAAYLTIQPNQGKHKQNNMWSISLINNCINACLSRFFRVGQFDWKSIFVFNDSKQLSPLIYNNK